MPIYGCFLVEGAPRHALIEGETAHFVEDLFGTATPDGFSAPLENLHILPPVMPRKLFAIGLNYADHAKESGQDVPQEPLMWFKAPSAIIAHRETVEIVYPHHRTDYEAELVIVIGKTAKQVKREDAPNSIFGYTLGQDISDRVVQRGESQWARAKSMDTYAPLGPFIYTDLDTSNLPIQCLINGEIKQNSNTNQMVFSPAQLVEFLSESITLEPGDCIMTGTPFGIGPLANGDEIETRIGEMKPLINFVKVRSEE